MCLKDFASSCMRLSASETKTYTYHICSDSLLRRLGIQGYFHGIREHMSEISAKTECHDTWREKEHGPTALCPLPAPCSETFL
ncbi:hypothetical protein TNCT_540231 [Trichonephila clavata]|uniref:Uncharacterized protein n=1 Tax=Trichonephila clavata TaxID=2740835 RepID=A0A8X6K326_TRICU|nr:hypothetical protein TNCT_540231 [Trichonephila clavata]